MRKEKKRGREEQRERRNKKKKGNYKIFWKGMREDNRGMNK